MFYNYAKNQQAIAGREQTWKHHRANLTAVHHGLCLHNINRIKQIEFMRPGESQFFLHFFYF